MICQNHHVLLEELDFINFFVWKSHTIKKLYNYFKEICPFGLEIIFISLLWNLLVCCCWNQDQMYSVSQRGKQGDFLFMSYVKI